MSRRALVWTGAALAVLSLGLPWVSFVADHTDYCDFRGCVLTSYSPGGSFTGADTVARFFIVAAVTLALAGGLHLASRRALRWAAYAGVAGVLLHVTYGLMGGMLALLAASVCFWLAARHVIPTEQAGAPSV